MSPDLPIDFGYRSRCRNARRGRQILAFQEIAQVFADLKTRCNSKLLFNFRPDGTNPFYWSCTGPALVLSGPNGFHTNTPCVVVCRDVLLGQSLGVAS
jgi:hypothetical protein